MNPTQTGDAIVDEVRRIRREISEQYGNDLDRLFAHLREVEREYAQRKGVFAHVTPAAAAQVVAGWGDVTGPVDDKIVAAVRGARYRSAE